MLIKFNTGKLLNQKKKHVKEKKEKKERKGNLLMFVHILMF